MIQRIQTLYLIAASLIFGLMLFFPMVSFVGGELGYELTSFGLFTDNASRELILSTTYMGVLNVLVAIIPLVIIFLYKNRILQIRLCYVSWVLMLGLQLFVGYYLYRVNSSIADIAVNDIRYSATVVLPLIGVALIWLSYRGIIKDEALVRSLDRLR